MAALAAAGFAGGASAQVTRVSAQITEGALSGFSTGDGVNRFFGIPYAQPPVGNLRWRAPQPAMPWGGVRDASRFGSSCPQDADMFGPASVNEDCLSVNVYAPAAPSAQWRPVLVWIHGGGFWTGAGSYYDASVLAARTNAVVVTLNYRLGVFGFLTTSGLRGENRALNFGLQDQYAALRWVQRNIAAFGGDAGRVTIAGQSAGGISGCLGLISPQAAGLFHRAILHSAPCIMATTPLLDAMSRGDGTGRKAGCAPGWGQMACLRSKSTAELLAAARLQTPVETISNAQWPATVDDVTVPGPVLNTLWRGRFQKVPVMLGTTLDEGRGMAGWGFHGVYKRGVTRDEYETAMAAFGGQIAASLVTTTYSPLVYGSVSRAAAQALTDVAIACGTASTAGFIADATPTYLFEFADRGAPQFFYDSLMPEGWGAYHMGELLYLFQRPVSGLQFPGLSASQRALSEQWLGYWRNFIATGNPNDYSSGGASGLPYWPRYRPVSTAVQTLKPGRIETQVLGEYKRDHQCALWSTTFDLGATLGQF
jgi:para-nitrobenzyl esterase